MKIQIFKIKSFAKGKLTVIDRHLSVVLPYITFRKLVNLCINHAEKLMKLRVLKSYPVVLKLDPGPFCQLNCPKCEFSRTSNSNYSKEDFLNLKNVREIIEPIKETLLWVSLSYRGEPFTNPYLIDIIKYIHLNNIAVSFPSNFSLKFSDDKIKKLVESGVDKIYVALDGFSQETTEKYRDGASVALILSNVKRLAEEKVKQHVSHPKIVWKFIVFDHNRHEVEFVKKTYEEFGFDDVEFFSDNYSKKNKEVSDRRKAKSKSCDFIWHTMVIESDGNVKPCCSSSEFGLGNAVSSDVREIWNSKAYQYLRNGFRRGNFPKKLHKNCVKCYGLK